MRGWVWGLCLLPAAWLAAGVFMDALGPNPVEHLLRSTGDWTLRLLCLTLAVTPVRVQCGWPWLAPYRRLLGLWTFFYACLHGVGYAWLDMEWAADAIWRDLAKRPFILVGFAAWAILCSLALTSPRGVVRWMGGRRWQRLHRLVYGAAVLSLLHFYWMRAAKNNLTEVAVYAALMGLLLAWRLVRRVAEASRRARPAQRAPMA